MSRRRATELWHTEKFLVHAVVSDTHGLSLLEPTTWYTYMYLRYACVSCADLWISDGMTAVVRGVRAQTIRAPPGEKGLYLYKGPRYGAIGVCGYALCDPGARTPDAAMAGTRRTMVEAGARTAAGPTLKARSCSV